MRVSTATTQSYRLDLFIKWSRIIFHGSVCILDRCNRCSSNSNSSSSTVNHVTQKKIRQTDMSSSVQGKLERMPDARALRHFTMMSELSADNNKGREEDMGGAASLAPVPSNWALWVMSFRRLFALLTREAQWLPDYVTACSVLLGYSGNLLRQT